MALPAIAAFLIAAISWRAATLVIGIAGLLGAAAILFALNRMPSASGVAEIKTSTETTENSVDAPRGGFALLLAIGIIDSATRTSLLTFLPFLLQAKGAGTAEIGLALSLLFAGGAAGKLVCGFLGGRLGVLPTVLITEGGTAITIMELLPLPLMAAFVLLPIVGIALNGTSSVLYGTVPELLPTEKNLAADQAAAKLA